MPLRTAVAVFLFTVLAACPASVAPLRPSAAPADTLRFGATPSANLASRGGEVAALARYLEQALGKPVTVEIPSSYLETSRALVTGSWDVALVGPVQYTRAHESGWTAVAVPEREGRTASSAVIVVRSDRGIARAADLKGKKVAFVAAESSTGYQFPFAWLCAQGLLAPDYQREFLGNHLQVVRAVFEGRFDAGGCYEEAVAQELSEAERSQVAILGRTDPSPAEVLCVRAASPQAKAVREALLALQTDPRAAAILGPMRAQRLVPAEESMFDPARRIDLLVSEENP